MHNGAALFLIVLFVLLALALRKGGRRREYNPRCPKCRRFNTTPNAVHCAYCGHNLD